MKLLKWFYMLGKRLYRKVAFAIILALILASVVVFAFAAKSESGFFRVALAQTESGDALSTEIVNEFLNDDTMLLFTLYDSPKAATQAVESGKADAAWIFPEMGETVGDYSLLKGDKVLVVEREQTVISRLAREKLNAVLFDYTAQAFYLTYAAENLPELDSLSNEELLKYFHEAKIDDELFVFDNPSSSVMDSSAYLTTPLRGLLGIIVTLGGMAGVLYYMKDEAAGLFAAIPLKKKPFVAFGCVSVATLNLSLLSAVSITASGIYKFTLTEIVSALLYALATAAFALAIKGLFRSIKVYGAVIPALITVTSVVCPVFFNLKAVRGLSFLFPPTYYINAALGGKYLLYMVIYTVCCLAVAFLLGKIIPQRR